MIVSNALNGDGFTGYALNFNGRGKFNGYNVATCAAETYFLGANVDSTLVRSCDGSSMPSPNATNFVQLAIDVWKAYRDGVWTSSVNIDVYILRDSGASADSNSYVIQARSPNSGAKDDNPATDGCGCVEKTGVTVQSANRLCANATTIKATVTVYDDGSISIA